MAVTTTVNREWIAAELAKGIAAEDELADDAAARAKSPPDPALSVLYHEIAEADARHKDLVETVAIRYGYTPPKSLGGGIGKALSSIRDSVNAIGTTPAEQVAVDLKHKANSIHWYTAWVRAFEAIGDSQSAGELNGALAEESAHRDALQQGLDRLVLQGVQP